MGQIEKEVKILNVDVNKIKNVLKNAGVEPKGKYIQDIYTFDLPLLEQLYINYVDKLIIEKDSRPIIKMISEIRPCFDTKDLMLIESIIGTRDLLDYIKNLENNFGLLKSEKLISLMKKTNENFSKWIRLRQTGKQTTVTIKKIVNSKGQYELDAVDELEFEVPNVEIGKEFLEDLGYFFARHQIKMRIAYDYKNTEIVIDKWPRIAPYVEIEGPSKEEIDEAIIMLGYKVENAIIINTDDVYKEIGIDIYSDEYKDLSFDDKEMEFVKKCME